MKKIYVFKWKNGICGFTFDEKGTNLPSKLEDKDVTWSFFKALSVDENEKPRIALDTKEMLAGIEEKGYYITQYKIESEIITN